MTKKITMNPVTRVSGFLQLDVSIDNHTVTDVKTSGLLFRGFERMMVGRSPFDAVYFTQRICGICSAAHSTAASMALEDALRIEPEEQGVFLRDIIHGCEFLQNHIRHFYQYTLPDFVRLPEGYPIFETSHADYRLPKQINDDIAGHYFESLEISRSAHEALATFGGKAPHNHGVFIGGVTTQATVDKIARLKAILSDINRFINSRMLPDALTIAHYYDEYFEMGAGSGNLLSYGCFNNYKSLGTLYLDPLVRINGKMEVFDPDNIMEGIDRSWYEGEKNLYKPEDIMTIDNMRKPDAYTWVKAPRYNGVPCEVGPLARQWLSGEYRHGISMMDRTIARVREAKKIARVVNELVEHVIPGTQVQKEYALQSLSKGKGLVDTTRGALGHWMKSDNDEISFYQIITPSAWNCSSSDDRHPGTCEQALLGTVVQEPDNPVELGRIIRSFDPCISCATHIIVPGAASRTIQVVP